MQRRNVRTQSLPAEKESIYQSRIQSRLAFVFRQTSGGHVRYFCRNCYASYTSEKSLAKHEELCQMLETVKIEMPKITEKHGLPTQSFTNHYTSQSVPFVVYADLESFTKTIHTCQPAERPEPNPNDSYTKKYQKHEPSGFCYYLKCFDDSVYSHCLVLLVFWLI